MQLEGQNNALLLCTLACQSPCGPPWCVESVWPLTWELSYGMYDKPVGPIQHYIASLEPHVLMAVGSIRHRQSTNLGIGDLAAVVHLILLDV